jgi:hypothetical protein
MLMSFGLLFLNEGIAVSTVGVVEAEMGLSLFRLNLTISDKFKGEDGKTLKTDELTLVGLVN